MFRADDAHARPWAWRRTDIWDVIFNAHSWWAETGLEAQDFNFAIEVGWNTGIQRVGLRIYSLRLAGSQFDAALSRRGWTVAQRGPWTQFSHRDRRFYRRGDVVLFSEEEILNEVTRPPGPDSFSLARIPKLVATLDSCADAGAMDILVGWEAVSHWNATDLFSVQVYARNASMSRVLLVYPAEPESPEKLWVPFDLRSASVSRLGDRVEIRGIGPPRDGVNRSAPENDLTAATEWLQHEYYRGDSKFPEDLPSKSRPAADFLGTSPRDPWGRPLFYRLEVGGQACTLGSVGPDGIPDTGDDILIHIEAPR